MRYPLVASTSGVSTERLLNGRGRGAFLKASPTHPATSPERRVDGASRGNRAQPWAEIQLLGTRSLPYAWPRTSADPCRLPGQDQSTVFVSLVLEKHPASKCCSRGSRHGGCNILLCQFCLRDTRHAVFGVLAIVFAGHFACGLVVFSGDNVCSQTLCFSRLSRIMIRGVCLFFASCGWFSHRVPLECALLWLCLFTSVQGLHGCFCGYVPELVSCSLCVGSCVRHR